MRLSVNGEEYVTEQDSVVALLKEMGIIAERVVVEVNLRVIKKKDFEHCRLRDGDTIEIVSFVGGGH